MGQKERHLMLSVCAITDVSCASIIKKRKNAREKRERERERDENT
jgi:hypothetical protein